MFVTRILDRWVCDLLKWNESAFDDNAYLVTSAKFLLIGLCWVNTKHHWASTYTFVFIRSNRVFSRTGKNTNMLNKGQMTGLVSIYGRVFDKVFRVFFSGVGLVVPGF